MKNLLLSAAIGDISGMPYEFEGRTKNYNSVDLLNPRNTYTDDTVCTFACAEALIHGRDMAERLWTRGREHIRRGFGGMFFRWLCMQEITSPYNSFGNGSAMRVAAAGFLATSEEECISLATQTALPTHNHPEGIKGAVATALAIYWAMEGRDKAFIKRNVLAKHYPDWAELTYEEVKLDYDFDETCQKTVPAAIISFLESEDYADCVKLAIALGGDADTLAAIAGPMAYAHYKHMPEELIANAMDKLPAWMLSINSEFDKVVEQKRSGNADVRTHNGTARPDFTPDRISSLKDDEVFVFGSNLAGMHGGGAARIAYQLFGAILGQGVGLQGQSYAIPTMQGGTETIKPYVDQFIQFAREHRELFFYVTRIGCGIAGFKDEEIAPLFKDAIHEKNICLPESFYIHTESASQANGASFDLDRFLQAQNFTYATAFQEIHNGQKRSHWIWYIFPQLAGLGYSANSQYYGISGMEEATAYILHPILGARLKEITAALLKHQGTPAINILGKIDALKVRSCMTLFDAVSPNGIFREALNAFYDGEPDEGTLSLLQHQV
jgi:uncharacterized protein (DUF1810 family)/ADP-ribosylglycohydrolase